MRPQVHLTRHLYLKLDPGRQARAQLLERSGHRACLTLFSGEDPISVERCSFNVAASHPDAQERPFQLWRIWHESPTALETGRLIGSGANEKASRAASITY